MAVIRKRVLCRELLRQVPPQFSWIDHRLVRDRHIAGKSTEALALYLFLVTVADGQGLSYYSDAGIGKLLRLDALALDRARQELIRARLIAYERPLYQVLSLDRSDPAATGSAVRLSSTLSTQTEGNSPNSVLRSRQAGLSPGKAVTSSPRLGEPQTIGPIIREMGRLT